MFGLLWDVLSRHVAEGMRVANRQFSRRSFPWFSGAHAIYFFSFTLSSVAHHFVSISSNFELFFPNF
jgi:hypothetical protein